MKRNKVMMVMLVMSMTMMVVMKKMNVKAIF